MHRGPQARVPEQAIQEQRAVDHAIGQPPWPGLTLRPLLRVDQRRINYLTKGTFLNLAMEYVPDTLSRVLKNKMISSDFLKGEAIKKYAYWLLSGLAYLSVIY